MTIQLPESTMISSLGFNPKGEVLTATYKSGGIYEYAGVTWETMRVLLDSASLGKAFHAIIKKNEHLYPYKRIA